jgi:hypothetical protein
VFGRKKKKKDPFREIQNCLQERDYKGALDWFNTLLKKDRKNTQIRLRFADTLVLAGSKKEAIKQYGIVASELAQKGFMIRAIAINKKILQLDPNHAEVRENLAELREERREIADSEAKTTNLADVLRPPGAPLRRSGPEPEREPTPAPAPAPAPAPTPTPTPTPAPAQAPPPAEVSTEAASGAPEETPAVLPELSLEESMAMEFGSSGTEEVTEVTTTTDTAAESESIEVIEIVDDAEPADSPGELEPSSGKEEAIPMPATLGEDVPISFTEEAMEFEESAHADGAKTSEEEEDAIEVVTLDSDAVELSMESEAPEIVLDVETPPSEPSTAGESDESVDFPIDVSAGDDAQDLEDEEVSGELEVIELDVETDSALAADGEQALVNALGEDIDALIDSIIDDVGISAEESQGKEPEPAPTHIPLFSDLTSAEFVDVAILLVRKVAKAGEVIVEEGEPGDSMFIVSTGEVEASVEKNGERVVVATLKDGDFFGEMAILTGEPRTATVTATKSTELLELSRAHLQEIFSRHPHVEAKIRLAYDERTS